VKRSRLVGLFAIAVLAHVESLSYWFVSTDTFALIRTGRVRSVGDLVATFTRPMMHGSGFTDVALFYRPLTTLSYALDYWLWGLAPAGYHATNLVLHGLAVVLAALAVAEVTRRSDVGAVAGVLFALHPLTAETVPVIARRQDVIALVFLLASLTLFLGSRREESTALFGGSLVAYALALAAKEPALLLPALVVTWVGVERGVPRDAGAVRDALRAVGPFVLVTAGYLAVRVAVLGGFGGYRTRPSLSVADAPALVAKYVLSLWYPSDTVGVGATGGAWALVPLAVLLLAGLVLAAAFGRPGTPRSPRAVPFLGFLVVVGAVPVLLAVDPAVLRPALDVLGYRRPTGDLPFAYPYPNAAAPLVGLCLVAAVVAGTAWALRRADVALDASTRRAVAFFAVWLALPVGLFYLSGDYAIRSGYLSLVPAMAVLALLLVRGTRESVRGTTLWSGAAPVLAVALLVVVPMVAATPLVHPYDGWESSGEVNRLTLTGLEAELDGTPDARPVRVAGLPTGIAEQQEAFPRVRSLGFLGPGSIEAWLALPGSGPARRVTVSETTELVRPPVQATFETIDTGDAVTVRVRYVEATPETRRHARSAEGHGVPAPVAQPRSR